MGLLFIARPGLILADGASAAEVYREALHGGGGPAMRARVLTNLVDLLRWAGRGLGPFPPPAGGPAPPPPPPLCGRCCRVAPAAVGGAFGGLAMALGPQHAIVPAAARVNVGLCGLPLERAG
jgi:hypothetical protein